MRINKITNWIEKWECSFCGETYDKEEDAKGCYDSHIKENVLTEEIFNKLKKKLEEQGIFCIAYYHGNMGRYSTDWDDYISKNLFIKILNSKEHKGIILIGSSVDGLTISHYWCPENEAANLSRVVRNIFSPYIDKNKDNEYRICTCKCDFSLEERF